MSDAVSLARALSVAFLAGAWERAQLLERGARVLGAREPWLSTLVGAVLEQFVAAPQLDESRLLAFVRDNRAFQSVIAAGAPRRPRLCSVVAAAASPPRSRWQVPALATTVDLAAFLGLTPDELDWFADRRRSNATSSPRLNHYRFGWVAKPRGGWRLLEVPKPRLKALQRRLLRELFAHVPCHDAAHGFVPGRSARSAAELHSGKAVVLRLDLADFFAAIRWSRVRSVCHAIGYSERVAAALAGLVSVAAPRAVLANMPAPSFHEFRDAHALAARRQLARHHAARHLAQGAPTSPVLANLSAFRLDLRLAKAAAGAGAVYSRYADDLIFSGGNEFRASVERFATLAAGIALDEGFTVNFRKTRVMRAGTRQMVAGIVVNRAPGVRRADRERLEAILTNAARSGLDSQNKAGRPDFLAYLRGRVAWVAQVNPAQARKLELLLARCER